MEELKPPKLKSSSSLDASSIPTPRVPATHPFRSRPSTKGFLSGLSFHGVVPQVRVVGQKVPCPLVLATTTSVSTATAAAVLFRLMLPGSCKGSVSALVGN